LIFNGNSGYAIAQQCYVVRTLTLPSLYIEPHIHENLLVIQFPFLVFCVRCFLQNHTHVRPLINKRPWYKQPCAVCFVQRSVLYLRGLKPGGTTVYITEKYVIPRPFILISRVYDVTVLFPVAVVTVREVQSVINTRDMYH